VHEFGDDETAFIARREVYEDFPATETGEKVLAGQTNRLKLRDRLRSSTDCNGLREPLSDRCPMTFSDDRFWPVSDFGATVA
jgi:hypothetical protein